MHECAIVPSSAGEITLSVQNTIRHANCSSISLHIG